MTKSDPILQDVYVVIPAKDEERFIPILIERLQSLGFINIIVVNDNSSDRTRLFAEHFQNVEVIDHVINLGAGAATQTGIAYAARNHAKYIATIDGDMQHNPADLIRLFDHMLNTDADLVIGSRFLQKNRIPGSRIFFNKMGNLISFVLTGKYLTDSQSGLKIMNQKMASHLNLNFDGFEFCMEIIKQARVSRCKISEIPIDVSYSKETLQKGQSFTSGLRMIGRLISPFS